MPFKMNVIAKWCYVIGKGIINIYYIQMLKKSDNYFNLWTLIISIFL